MMARETCHMHDCEGELRILIDGSTVCTECGHAFGHERYDMWDNEDYLADYNGYIADLLGSDFNEVRKEFLAGIELYCKGPFGFPDKQSYRRFPAVFMVYVMRLTTDVYDRIDDMNRRLLRLESTITDLDEVDERDYLM